MIMYYNFFVGMCSRCIELIHPLDKTIDTIYNIRSSDLWFHLNLVGYKDLWS